jgi:hypothetical protein
MLARRKAKPQDDEPLVPHGLISQALDTSLSVSDNSSSTQVNSASPTTLEAQKRPAARVLRWPRATRQVKEGMRLARALPITLQHAREQTRISRNQISTSWRQACSIASQHAGRIRDQVARVIPPTLDRIRSSIQFSVNVARCRNFSAAYASKAVVLCRNWSSQAATNLQRLKDAASHRLSRIRGQAELQEPLPPIGFRVRIHLAGAPLKARIAWARASSEWDLRRESLSRNSRLWTSLALSALSALAVMGIFSTARHYAKASLPSTRAATISSTKNADTAAVVVPLTVKAPSRVSDIHTSHPQSVSAKPKPAKPKIQAGTVPSRHKIRRNEDEDYVAKDTYVYYGKRRSELTKTAKD